MVATIALIITIVINGLVYIADFPPKNEITQTLLLNKSMISQFYFNVF